MLCFPAMSPALGGDHASIEILVPPSDLVNQNSKPPGCQEVQCQKEEEHLRDKHCCLLYANLMSVHGGHVNCSPSSRPQPTHSRVSAETM
jgi:hypothetical protein